MMQQSSTSIHKTGSAANAIANKYE